MKKMVALTLALLMAASLFLSGCSVRKDTSDSENSGSSNGSGSGDRVVNVCSWGEYIDESLIDQFEEATGIKVNYQTAESNEVLYSQLSMGGVDYDVIVPSDYMISQLIEVAEVCQYAETSDGYPHLGSRTGICSDQGSGSCTWRCDGKCGRQFL